MRIYIPQHLKKLGIFEDLCKMVLKYEESYVSPVSSFDDYQSYMKIDPVLRFISFCITRKDDQSEEEYLAILEYLTRLFYSIRGTQDVFTYITRYLGIEFEGEPVYTTKLISFSIKNSQEWYDASLFNEYLISFLNNLLYYENLKYNIDLSLRITDTLEFSVGTGVKTYKIYKIE